jgi:hypothetical protein
MATSLIAGCLWVLAAAGTAMLPMRRQMAPGLVLLALAPLLILWIGAQVSWWFSALALFAFLSMFRRPLWALVRWALTGRRPVRPTDVEEAA